MLGKLIKYDFKATYKMHCGMYFILILFSLISMFLKIGLEGAADSRTLLILSPIMSLMAILARIAVIFVTVIAAVLRYRRNILKDEGYLMNTLPVRKAELLFSKIIVPFCWMLINIFMIYISMAVELRDITPIDFYMFVGGAIELTAGSVILFVAVFLVTIFSAFSIFYLCLNLGYSFSKDRDLRSFIAYIVIYLINQAVNSVGLIIASVINSDGISDMVNMQILSADYFITIFVVNIIITVMLTVIYNFVSIYLLNKKLNLE